MTRDEALTALVEQWNKEAAVLDLPQTGQRARELSKMERQRLAAVIRDKADELSALLREAGTDRPTCATCTFWDDSDNYPQGVCRMHVRFPSQSLTMYPQAQHFGCTLHEPTPAPPAAPGDPR